MNNLPNDPWIVEHEPYDNTQLKSVFCAPVSNIELYQQYLFELHVDATYKNSE